MKLYSILLIGSLSAAFLSAMHDDSGDYLSLHKRIEELRQELIQLNEFDISNQQRDVHETEILDEIYKLNQEIDWYQKLKKEQQKK